MHEHFDAENQLVGTTVVTRESPWDEATRQRALTLTRHEAGLCSCGCGLPMTVAHDKDSRLVIDSFVCRAGQAIAMQRRKDEDANKNNPDFTAGRHYFARVFDPIRDADLKGAQRKTPAPDRAPRRGRSGR